MADHFLLLVWHALLISVFFAFLWRDDRRGRLRFLLTAFAALVAGSVAIGWLMYPFP